MTWIVLLASIIIAFIAITPLILTRMLNSALNKHIQGYSGKIERLSIGFFTGKLTARNLTLHSIVTNDQLQPTLQLPVIEVAFKWTQLFKKVLDLNVTIHNPVIHLISASPAQGSNEIPAPTDQHRAFKDSLEKMMSFKVDVAVIEGEIRYVNSHTGPEWEASIYHLNCNIQNFSNRIDLSNSCRIKCDFQMCDGTGEVNLTIQPLAANLTLAIEFELRSLNLVLLNGLFHAYGNVDINSGILDLQGKVAVIDNVVKGYLNPVLHELDFIGRSDRSDTIFQKIWERIVAGVFSIVFRRRNGSMSAIIPIEGRLDDPDLSDGAAIMAIVRKATIKAFTPSIDVRDLWQKVRSKTKNVIRRLLPKST